MFFTLCIKGLSLAACFVLILYCVFSNRNLRWNKLQYVLPPEIGGLKSLTFL